MLLLATDNLLTAARFQAILQNKSATFTVADLAACRRQMARAPDLLVFDLPLAGARWRETVEALRASAPSTRILAVADDFSAADEILLLGLGVGACCDARLAAPTLERIVDMVLDGGVWISNTVLPRLLQQLQAGALAAGLPGAGGQGASSASPAVRPAGSGIAAAGPSPVASARSSPDISRDTPLVPGAGGRSAGDAGSSTGGAARLADDAAASAGGTRQPAGGVEPSGAGATARLRNLTPREREIARLVGTGASNKLIARELDITDRTVKAHLGAIFQKLGTPDRLRLAVYLNEGRTASTHPDN